MRITKLLILILISLSLNVFAIFNDYEPSPKARAMGGAFYTASDDAYGVYYNPAGLMHSDDNLALSYAKIFGNDFQVLNTMALAMKLPKKFGTLGLGMQAMDVTYQDVNLQSEKIYAISHAFRLLKDIHSELNFGYTFNLYHLSFDRFGEQPTFGLNLGALATLHQRTKIGFAMTNVNKPKVGEDNFHKLPQKLAMGISYEPYTGVITAIELKKPFAGETEIHSGVEVKVNKLLALHFGARSNPASYSAGARFNVIDILIDYSYNSHTMGGTHHFGIGYQY